MLGVSDFEILIRLSLAALAIIAGSFGIYITRTHPWRNIHGTLKVALLIGMAALAAGGFVFFDALVWGSGMAVFLIGLVGLIVEERINRV